MLHRHRLSRAQFLLHGNTCFQDLAFPDTKGSQASSRSGHRGTSKVWQGKGGSITKWGFVCAVHRIQTSVAHEHKEYFTLWMRHASSSCPDRTCRHNRWYKGRPGVTKVKSPRQWYLVPQESPPPVSGSTSPMLSSGQVYSCMALCHNVWGKCHYPGSGGSTSKTCACSSCTSSGRSLRCVQCKPGKLGIA